MRLHFANEAERKGCGGIVSGDLNSNINRQLKMMLRRLKFMSQEGRNDHYWKFASLMLKKSKSLRMLALRNVRPNWYKDMSMKDLIRTLYGLNGICFRPRKTFEIKRTAIPKDDGSRRFINAPDLKSRLYLWMVNFFLGIFLEDKLNPNQFGHRHGRGSADAWRKILEVEKDYKFVYEFDFKGFHDEIRRHFLVKALTNIGVSEEWTIKLGNLCSAYVKDVSPDDPFRDYVAREEYKYHHFWKGVVQGLNTAGLCGLVVLEELKVYEVPHGIYVGYADDGLIFTNEERDIEDFKSKLDSEESGVYLKETKSGWIRKDGIDLKPIRFIGIEFDGEFLRARTRSGKDWSVKWEGPDTKIPVSINEVIHNSRLHSEMKGTVRTLDNNLKYLGTLFAALWSENPYKVEGLKGIPELKEEIKKLEEGLPKAFSRSWWYQVRKHVKPEIRDELNLFNVSTVAYGWLQELLRDPRFSRRQRLWSRGNGKPNWSLSSKVGGQVAVNGRGMTVTNKLGYLAPSAYPNPCPEIMKVEHMYWYPPWHVERPAVNLSAC